MKLLTILGLLFASSVLSAQELKLNKKYQELIFNSEKPSQSREAQLLRALLNNADNIQLKDGTVIRIIDDNPRLEDSRFNEANLEKMERELRVISGSGGGTGGGG